MWATQGWIVSNDFIGDTHSSIFLIARALRSRRCEGVSWYDNECSDRGKRLGCLYFHKSAIVYFMCILQKRLRSLFLLYLKHR
jgi:hypothetical protein